MATRSQRTSDLYDSRKVPRKKGIGYPSCSRELAVLAPNTKDPHGYYREIGVSPGATHGHIRLAVRALLRELHPDTGTGDTERFNRVLNIAKVLLDEESRARYNNTPKGMRMMDAVAMADMSKLDGLQGLNEEQLREVLKPKKAANPYATNLGARYDYFARGHLNDPWQADELKAQLWYHFLIGVAPMFKYRGVIKVLIHDGEPRWHHDVGIMEIPRTWEPSSAAAMSLFSVAAGFRPGHDDPQTR